LNDFELKELVGKYVHAKLTPSDSRYETVEKVCPLRKTDLRKFLEYFVNFLNENFIDRRAELRKFYVDEVPDLKAGDSGIYPHDLGDKFLDTIAFVLIKEVIADNCNLDDTKNELLSFLSFTGSRTCMYFKPKNDFPGV